MSRIYVLHENDEWTDHLTERLEELDLPYDLWHLDEGTLDLTSEPPEGVFYNRISASSHTRGHRYAPEFAEAVLAWLERHGRVVVNGSRALRLEVSKVNQYMALNQTGIRTPQTVTASGKGNIAEAARKLDRKPFITKHNRAGKGQGVQLFHSSEALQEYLESDSFEEPVDGMTLIQQYIEAPQPFIIRHEFVGGKFVYGVRVDTSDGFELCPADACSIDESLERVQQPKAEFEILEDYRPAIVEDYERFLQENEIQVAGIEAIEDQDGRLYTYDVNTNTNYNSEAETVAGTYGMLELAKYLGGLLQQSVV